jgi:hypothetical protein
VSTYCDTAFHLCAGNIISQFDMQAPDIAASRTTITSITNTASSGMLKLGPDGKIYWTWMDQPFPDPDSVYTSYNNNLSVINYPDSAGLACDFQPFSYNLGNGRCGWTFPNNPYFELGPLAGSPCDTLSIGIPKLESKSSVSVFPNPCNNQFIIKSTSPTSRLSKAELYDNAGRLLLVRNFDGLFNEQTLNVSYFQPGCYLLAIYFNNTIEMRKIDIIR